MFIDQFTLTLLCGYNLFWINKLILILLNCVDCRVLTISVVSHVVESELKSLLIMCSWCSVRQFMAVTDRSHQQLNAVSPGRRAWHLRSQRHIVLDVCKTLKSKQHPVHRREDFGDIDFENNLVVHCVMCCVTVIMLWYSWAYKLDRFTAKCNVTKVNCAS